MARRRSRPIGRAVGLVLLGCAGLAPASADAAAPIWRLEQPPPPPGAPFKVPLGIPGDLKLIAPNRGLLSVEGNATVARGLYAYNGQVWHPLATVCGGSGDTSRIAVAGPSEFWTISEPSRPRTGSGLALCHFKGGEVVASYSAPDQSPDPFRRMNAAACNGPNDCWFGGVGDQDPTGERLGAFHLHWDGASLTSVYAPQGRGVSDLQFSAGKFWESVFVGRRPEDRVDAVDLTEPESPEPRLLHSIAGGAFANDPFVPTKPAGVPNDGTELLGLDADGGGQLWAVGGGAASGPSAPPGGSVPRPPVALRYTAGAWTQLPIDAGLFGPNDRFGDVAAVPGATSAWVTTLPFAERASTSAKAKVALVSATGATTTFALPAGGAGRGSAARIACSGPTDCWMVTYAGWLFHYTDGAPQPLDTDPAFGGTITFRPNEAAEQFIPDRPPVDDSQLFAPPPVSVAQSQPKVTTKVTRLSPLLRNVRSRLRGHRLTITFRLVRKARVGLLALRRSKVVARAGARLMRPGRRSVSVRLNPRRWPTRLRFIVNEPGQKPAGGDDGDSVTTPGPANPNNSDTISR